MAQRSAHHSVRPHFRALVSQRNDLTHLLHDAAANPDALGAVFELVYHELRQLAAAYMSRERHGHTLAATALVHEAWLRLYPARVVREHALHRPRCCAEEVAPALEVWRGVSGVAAIAHIQCGCRVSCVGVIRVGALAGFESRGLDPTAATASGWGDEVTMVP